MKHAALKSLLTLGLAVALAGGIVLFVLLGRAFAGTSTAQGTGQLGTYISGSACPATYCITTSTYTAWIKPLPYSGRRHPRVGLVIQLDVQTSIECVLQPCSFSERQADKLETQLVARAKHNRLTITRDGIPIRHVHPTWARGTGATFTSAPIRLPEAPTAGWHAYRIKSSRPADLIGYPKKVWVYQPPYERRSR